MMDKDANPNAPAFQPFVAGTLVVCMCVLGGLDSILFCSHTAIVSHACEKYRSISSLADTQ